MNTSIHSGTALITGASSSIGIAYADRLARRGHDLIMVARDREHLCALASGITDDTGRSVEVLAANLRTRAGLRAIERVLENDASITTLVTNAETRSIARPLYAGRYDLDRMIDRDVLAPTRLACAAYPGFAARGHGTIINIAAFATTGTGRRDCVSSGTAAFTIAFSQALHDELASKGIRVQVVLADDPTISIPVLAATCSGRMVTSVGKMVDAALAAFDRGEVVTSPRRPMPRRIAEHRRLARTAG